MKEAKTVSGKRFLQTTFEAYRRSFEHEKKNRFFVAVFGVFDSEKNPIEYSVFELFLRTFLWESTVI